MSIYCGDVVAKYCLTFFNFLFFLAGGILLSLGIWLAAHKNSFIRLVTNLSQDETLHQFSQPTVIEQAAWIMIAAGTFIFIISCLGYCGATRSSYCMLGTYAVLVVIVLILEITAAGLAARYNSEANVATRKFLKTTIKKYYSSPDRIDAVTLMWNYLMAQFQCCGVDSFEDFSESQKFRQSRQTVPAACCVLTGEISQFKPLDSNCIYNPSESNSYYRKGCYYALSEWIQDNLYIVIIVCLGLAAIQVLGIVFACCLCHTYINY